MSLSLQHLLRYADEGEDMLNRNVTASLPTRIKSCFNAMETSQFTFKQKVQGYAISWEGYAYSFFGIVRSMVKM
jgi:hypothetical protein